MPVDYRGVSGGKVEALKKNHSRKSAGSSSGCKPLESAEKATRASSSQRAQREPVEPTPGGGGGGTPRLGHAKKLGKNKKLTLSLGGGERKETKGLNGKPHLPAQIITPEIEKYSRQRHSLSLSIHKKGSLGTPHQEKPQDLQTTPAGQVTTRDTRRAAEHKDDPTLKSSRREIKGGKQGR